MRHAGHIDPFLIPVSTSILFIPLRFVSCVHTRYDVLGIIGTEKRRFWYSNVVLEILSLRVALWLVLTTHTSYQANLLLRKIFWSFHIIYEAWHKNRPDIRVRILVWGSNWHHTWYWLLICYLISNPLDGGYPLAPNFCGKRNIYT